MSSEKLEPDTSDDHLIPLAELEKRLKTSLETGLTATEAKARLERNGPNALSPPKQTPEWIKFCKTMFAGFAGILWSAAFLCFIAYIVDASSNPDDVQPDNLYVGGALTCVVIISGLFTYYQERSSGKIMDSFAKMVPPKARACRDGKMVDVEAADLVVGDIVEIQSGDKTPADIRILKCSTLKVDNSSLTGESLPCKLNPGDSNEIRIQSKNMAFFSTNVLEGKGTGVIIETGDKTVIGNIAGLVSGMAAGQTPINKEIKKFISVITFIAVFLAVSFFIIALSMGYNVVKATLFLIGILVANVPEGLLVTVTITLSLTAKRMAQKNCLVKHLEGVETLGSTSVICSDKTGTLTQNKMTVSHFWFNNKILELDTSEGSFASGFDTKEAGWVELAMVGCLCSTATFADGHDDESLRTRPIRGDASEQGILRCYESIVGNSAEVRESNPKVAEIPFNSSNKYQVSVHNTDNNGTFHLVMKGAPEIVFNYCSTVLFGDQEFPVDQTTTQAFEDANKQLGEKGERVLAFCDLYLDTNEFGPDFVFDTDQINFPLTGLRFVGLMSMVDPPKSTVPDAVSKCRSAGIKVIMVTGDQPITAAAIARKVGIIDPSHKEVIYDEHTDPTEVGGDEIAGVISGGVLGKISDETLDSIIQNHWEIVFARTSPEQKLRIVEGFQRSGAIVAVTGDGVNDSPALKKGDIGVAMGISGSEVSKEAADMILLDDNFATIVVGVEEGRLIFDNLKKSIIYTLTSNIPEIFPFLSWVILNIPLPLATITILLVDLGTDMLPAISLAHETAENDIMLRKPRNPEKDRLVNGHLIFLSYGVIGMMQMAAGFFTYFIIMDEHGWKPSRLFGIRSEWDNKELNNLEDSYGQEWTFGQRKVLEGVCQTAYFIAIVEVQWTDLIISKTRVVSITSQKMKNTMLNGALLFETILAIILIYTPTIPQFIGLYPLNPQWWIPALPFSLLIWAMDEFRRYLLRRNKTHPSGLTQFIENETYY